MGGVGFPLQLDTIDMAQEYRYDMFNYRSLCVWEIDQTNIYIVLVSRKKHNFDVPTQPRPPRFLGEGSRVGGKGGFRYFHIPPLSERCYNWTTVELPVDSLDGGSGAQVPEGSGASGGTLSAEKKNLSQHP